MTATPHRHLFDLQKLVINLALIDRNHYLAGTDRRENDVEHSYMVAVLSWFIIEKYSLPLDHATVLKYALSHDIVEVYAGDTNAFASKKERQQKQKNEAASLARLTNELDDFPALIDTMRSYEDRQDDESLFVWTVDKLQALIMGDLDTWRPYEEMIISYDDFCQKYDSEILANSSPYAREIFEGFVEYSKTTYYDKPVA
ncbi:MAG: HD domain-containing protein [Candidatus Saccharimonadales bacterium]